MRPLQCVFQHAFLLFLIIAEDAFAQTPKTLKRKTANQVIQQLGKHASPRTRPDDDTGASLNVSISMHIMSIHSISEESMDMTVELYLRQLWVDPRLRYDNGPDILVLNPQAAAEIIWVPDVFLPDSKASVLHVTTFHPDCGFLLYPNGKVIMSSRHSFTLHCDMNLRSFPFDEQTCMIRLESYMFSNVDLNLQWMVQGFSMAGTINPVAFSVTGADHEAKSVAVPSGTFQQLIVNVHLRRLSAHHVAALFVPMTLLVAMTSLLFWLPPAALTARSTFGGFLFLCTVVLAVASQIACPQVGYLKKVDVWVLFCLLWEALAVIHIIALHLARIHFCSSQPDTIELDSMSENSHQQQDTLTKQTFHFQECLKKADYALRAAFPVGFLLFTIIFFLVK